MIDAVGLWSRTPTFFRSAVETFCNVSTRHLLSLDLENQARTVFFMKTVAVLQRLHSVSVYWQVVDA